MKCPNPRDGHEPSEFIAVVFLAKGKERYSIAFDSDARGRVAALLVVGRWAANPELSFTKRDAVTLARKIIETAENPKT